MDEHGYCGGKWFDGVGVVIDYLWLRVDFITGSRLPCLRRDRLGRDDNIFGYVRYRLTGLGF